MPVTLQNPSNVKLPNWLTDQSSSQGLQNFQTQLPQLFDTSGLQQASQAYNQSFANRAEMGFDAQSRAAQNRAMLSGGRVGSSFAKGGLMLGLQQNTNQNNLDYARLAASMMAQRAGLQGQTAGQLADYGQRRQGMLSDFTQGQQRLGLSAQESNQQAAQQAAALAFQNRQLSQQSSQFGQSLDLQRQQLNMQGQNDAAQRAALALRLMPQNMFNYNVNTAGIPMTAFDAQQQAKSDASIAQRQGYLSRIALG